MFDPQQRQREEIAKTLVKAGIPRKYHDVRLKSVVTGNPELTDIFESAENTVSFFNTYQVLNLQSVEGNFLEVLPVLVKAFMVCGKHAILTSLSTLVHADSETQTTLLEHEVIAITRFYDSHFSDMPFDRKTGYHLEEFFTDYLNGGGTLVLGSTNVISECTWFSKPLRNQMRLSGLEVCLDTGYQRNSEGSRAT